MKDSCVVDSSVLVKIILENDIELTEKLQKFVIYIPTNVLEETAFKIIISVCSEVLKSEKFFEIKEFYSQNSEKIKEIKLKMEALKTIKSCARILEINEDIFDLACEISIKYGLLPNDALIAATCKYYGISKIATFDEDFEKIDFVEVVKV